jgi:hypothetical protein
MFRYKSREVDALTVGKELNVNAVAFSQSTNGETRVRLGFDDGVFRFLQALQVATGACNVNQLLVVGALTR